MFSLLSRRRPTGLRRRPRFVLRLEGLENREQPDSTIVESSSTSSTSETTTNQPPEIVDFSCQEIESGTFVITGRVLDENPEGLTVTLGGSTSAAGTTIVCDSEGYFYIVVQLKTDGTDSGYITAQTVDAEGLESNVVEQFVNPTPP